MLSGNASWRIRFTEGHWPAVILGILIGLIYFVNVPGELSFMDDDVLILANTGFFDQWRNLPAIFTKDAFLNGSSAFYRPIQVLSYFIEWQLYGNYFTGFFLDSAILHWTFCCLIFIFLQRFLKNSTLSLLLAALFASHPLFVHGVSWLPGRGELLLGIFSLMALLSLDTYLATGRRIFLIAFLSTVLLALLTKETAVVIPFLAIPIIFLTGRVEGPKIRQNLILASFASIGVISLYFMLRLQVINEAAAGTAFSPQNIIMNSLTLPELVGKFILPINLSPLPRHDILHALTGAATFLLLVFVLHKTRRWRDPLVISGIIWFVGFSAPALTFTHGMSAFSYEYLEQRAYVPAIGFLLVGGALLRHVKFADLRFLVPVVVVIGLLSILTVLHVRYYKNPETFFGRALRLNPRDALAYYNRGNARHRANQLDEAMGDYDAALGIYPNYRDARNNRGIIFAMRGEHQKAITDFSQAISLKPTDTKLYLNRGVSRLMVGERETGCKDILVGIETDNGKGKPFYKKYCESGSVVVK